MKSGSAQSWTLLIGHVNLFSFWIRTSNVHASGKSDQNIIVIVSNERLVAAIYLWNFSIQLNECEKHGAGLSCGHHAYNSIQPTSGHHAY